MRSSCPNPDSLAKTLKYFKGLVQVRSSLSLHLKFLTLMPPSVYWVSATRRSILWVFHLVFLLTFSVEQRRVYPLLPLLLGQVYPTFQLPLILWPCTIHALHSTHCIDWSEGGAFSGACFCRLRPPQLETWRTDVTDTEPLLPDPLRHATALINLQ